jgi:nucleoside-diphosphate-sugar epimerase
MNKNEKLIIFGDSGYIGSSLVSRLKSVNRDFSTAGRSQGNDVFLDLQNPHLEALDVLSAGDKFIFLAAVSSPEFCSKYYDEAFKINVVNTCKIIHALLSKNVKVLFASSDVVYGPTEEPVDELSSLQPSFHYAEMKAAVEKEFKTDSNFNVMRLSYVWSIDDKFTQFIVNSSRSQAPIEIFHPFIRSIITLKDVLDFLIVYADLPEMLPPVINLAGPDFISRVRLISEISKYLKIEYTVVYPDDEFFRYRPERILMRSRFLASIIGRDPHSIASEIKNCFS